MTSLTSSSPSIATDNSLCKMTQINRWQGVIIAIVLANVMGICLGHGRLIEPPSRSSAFRYGFQTPPNYNDHELYCGGFARQQRNHGKCGECGDPWDVPEPRPNEHGGTFGQGVIVRRYKIGGDITIRVELTASHMGYFEFRLCPMAAAKQDCLDKNLLQIISGVPSVPQPGDLTTRFYPRNGSRIYEIKALLPEGLECANCVIQWRYIAGNNWGTCPDGSGAVGCGPQEEFRACADIAIGTSAPGRPVRPGIKTTPRAKIIDATQTTTESDIETFDEPIYEVPRYISSLIIAMVALLIVLCLLAAIYLYYYHGQRVKQFMHWNQHQHQKTPMRTAAMSSPPNVPPAAPPRTKRLSQTIQTINPYDSNVMNGFSR